jgi:hypothetical protein
MKNIRLVHILTETETEREQASINSLSPLSNLGIEYIQQVNQRYSGDDWKNVPAVSQSPWTNHGPGHYGAFQSFKKAMQDNFDESIDALVLCECDCVLECAPDFFVRKLREGIDFCDLLNVGYLSLGSRFVNGVLQSPVQEENEDFPDFYVTNKIILAHCVILPKKSRNFIMDCLEKYSWDSPDIWFNEIFWREGIARFGIIKDRLARQHEGFSLIDNHWKESQ